MLFVLTGTIQTGKTRWLEKLVDDVRQCGVAPYGVLAPGVWADRRGKSGELASRADANGFEKLGIDNVLLPAGERLTFARRADIAESEGAFDANAQSAQAKLGWHISDEAISRVNAHFAELQEQSRSDALDEESPQPGILVVDELGRLELERAGGLTQALSVLDAGPTPLYRHALIVVREALLPHLDGRFGAWGERAFLFPDDASYALVLSAVCG